jgi:uncharacterized protein (TIGR03435 family)
MMRKASMAFLLTLAFRAAGLSQPPPAFEVASIKPSPLQPIGRDSRRMSTSRGRLVYTHVSLVDLIVQAYIVQRQQILGPSWLDGERFDISARIPEQAGRAQVAQMLQGLLAERFRLQLHREKKKVPVYALGVAKKGPKLAKAESESGLHSSLGNVRAHADGAVSMAALAAFLSGRLDRPVLDRTRLSGPYTMALNWAPDALENAGAGPSLFTALQEQLGLKLTATRGPMDVLVIESVQRMPTEN